MLQIPEIWELTQSGCFSALGRERGEAAQGFWPDLRGSLCQRRRFPLHLLFRKEATPKQTDFWWLSPFGKQRFVRTNAGHLASPGPRHRAVTLCVPGCPGPPAPSALCPRPQRGLPGPGRRELLPPLYNDQTVSLGAQFPRQIQPKQLIRAFVSRMPLGGGGRR